MSDILEQHLANLKVQLGDALPDNVEVGEIPPLTRPLTQEEADWFNNYVNLIEPWSTWL